MSQVTRVTVVVFQKCVPRLFLLTLRAKKSSGFGSRARPASASPCAFRVQNLRRLVTRFEKRSRLHRLRNAAGNLKYALQERKRSKNEEELLAPQKLGTSGIRDAVEIVFTLPANGPSKSTASANGVHGSN